MTMFPISRKWSIALFLLFVLGCSAIQSASTDLHKTMGHADATLMTATRTMESLDADAAMLRDAVLEVKQPIIDAADAFMRTARKTGRTFDSIDDWIKATVTSGAWATGLLAWIHWRQRKDRREVAKEQTRQIVNETTPKNGIK